MDQVEVLSQIVQRLEDLERGNQVLERKLQTLEKKQYELSMAASIGGVALMGVIYFIWVSGI